MQVVMALSSVATPSAHVCAYIGLGSNLDDPRRHVTTALDDLRRLPETRLVSHSGLYGSRPWGLAEQPDYVNAVAALYTTLSARALLTRLLAIEADHGRIRTELRWGPRSLDLDLLLYGDLQSRDELLCVPHPRLSERNFVLYPLYEIAADLVIPGLGPLRELLRHCPRQGLTPLAN